MIFVTVGTQLHFDRLLQAIDLWASERGRTDVFAQTGGGSYQPSSVTWEAFLSPEEFQKYFDEAAAIVAHAGMGTILSALRQGKPLLVMPRRAHLGEQRSDHQLDTARAFARLGQVAVAETEEALSRKLDTLDEIRAGARIGEFARGKLIEEIRGLVAAAIPDHRQASTERFRASNP